MNAALAVGIAVDLLTGVVELQAKLAQVSAALQKARAEGRDLSDDELKAIVALDDAARERLQSLLG